MQASEITVHDPEQMFRHDGNLKLRILDRHNGIVGSRKTLRSTNARINCLSITPRSQIEGSVNKNWFYFSVRPTTTSSVFLNKSQSSGADSTVTLLGNDEFFACCEHGYRIYNVGLNRDLLDSEKIPDGDDKLLETSTIYQIPTWMKHKVSQQLAVLTTRKMDEATFEEAIAHISNTLLAVVSPETRLTTTNRYRIIQTSIELVQGNVYRRFSPEELAQASHCSIRTLQYAFRRTLGLSPKQFIDRYRLNRFRQELLERGSRSVISIASQYDFQHLGNLSRVYKQLFGETPSESH